MDTDDSTDEGSDARSISESLSVLILTCSDPSVDSVESVAEPILRANMSRCILLPIAFSNLWDLYKQAEASFWTAEEIDLSKDVVQWRMVLSAGERFFISRVLAFFAASDWIVNEHIVQQFSTEVHIAEARCFYGFQVMM